MKFNTYLPSDSLKPFVKWLAISELDDESTYRVLPYTGLVIGFQYKGRLWQLLDGKVNSLAVSGVSGLTDQSRAFKNSSDIGTVLVFFREGGAAPFFKHPIHELFRESISLDNFKINNLPTHPYLARFIFAPCLTKR